ATAAGIIHSPCQSDPRRIASRILPRAFLCVTEFLRTTASAAFSAAGVPTLRPGDNSVQYPARRSINLEINLALPYTNHVPSKCLELPAHAPITSHVRPNFFDPVIAVVPPRKAPKALR